MAKSHPEKTNRRKFLKTAAAASAGTVAAVGVVNTVSPAVWREEMAFTPNRSFWSRALTNPNGPVERDLDVDTAVIGGGFTGLS